MFLCSEALVAYQSFETIVTVLSRFIVSVWRKDLPVSFVMLVIVGFHSLFCLFFVCFCFVFCCFVIAKFYMSFLYFLESYPTLVLHNAKQITQW